MSGKGLSFLLWEEFLFYIPDAAGVGGCGDAQRQACSNDDGVTGLDNACGLGGGDGGLEEEIFVLFFADPDAGGTEEQVHLAGCPGGSGAGDDRNSGFVTGDLLGREAGFCDAYDGAGTQFVSYGAAGM